MEKTAFDARYQEYLAAIEDYLNSLFAEKPHWADLYEAMRYSVLSGGKLVHELTERAVSAVSDLDRDGFLTALAESLTERTK